MTPALIIFGITLAILIVAAGWDIASYTIPNTIQLALMAAFAGFVVAAGIPLSVAGTHLLCGLAGLALGFTLFALGYIGGGDAKFFACAALWLGFHDMAAYTLVAAVLGGGLSLLLLSFRTLPLPVSLTRQGWVARLYNPRSGVPYGVALAAGFFIILPQTDIYRIALGV
jgi:prepilin peptidase CpaA